MVGSHLQAMHPPVKGAAMEKRVEAEEAPLYGLLLGSVFFQFLLGSIRAEALPARGPIRYCE